MKFLLKYTSWCNPTAEVRYPEYCNLQCHHLRPKTFWLQRQTVQISTSRWQELFAVLRLRLWARMVINTIRIRLTTFLYELTLELIKNYLQCFNVYHNLHLLIAAVSLFTIIRPNHSKYDHLLLRVYNLCEAHNRCINPL